MSIAALIARTYVAPRAVIGHWLTHPRHEGRSLAMLMGGCAVICLSVLPYAMRLPGEAPPEARVAAAVFAWMAVAPLGFFVIAGLLQLLWTLVGRRRDGHDVRLALFWSVLAAAPLWLLNGAGLVLPMTGAEAILGAVALIGFLVLVGACQIALTPRATALQGDAKL
jgi:hypothetical protein